MPIDRWRQGKKRMRLQPLRPAAHMLRAACCPIACTSTRPSGRSLLIGEDLALGRGAIVHQAGAHQPVARGIHRSGDGRHEGCSAHCHGHPADCASRREKGSTRTPIDHHASQATGCGRSRGSTGNSSSAPRRPTMEPAAALASAPFTQSFLPRTVSARHCGNVKMQFGMVY